MITDIQVQHELLKTALESTDAYLGIEEHAKNHAASGAKTTNQMLHDFTYHMSRAHDALQTLGVLDQHQDYMSRHVAIMMKLHGHDDQTISDLPYAHVPAADVGEVEESVKPIKIKMNYPKASKAELYQEKLRKEKGLPDPSHYKKLAAQKQKEIEDMKSESRVISFTSYISEEKENVVSEKEINEIVDELSWEDIVDFYDDDVLVDVENEEELDEALSAQARIKKRQAFQRSKGKRNLARNLKLRRTSDPSTLQKRARQAAKRSIYKRLLKGRNRSQLSPAEKDRIEKQVSSMKNVMATLQQKFVPKIRSIEQKRIAHYRGKK